MQIGANSRVSSSLSRASRGFQIVQNIDVGHDGMMRNALQSLVAEMAGFAATDHRRGDFKLGEATQAGKRGDNRRRVADLIFSEVNGLPREDK